MFKSKEKHLKQGEKISNLENASHNLIPIPLTICKKIMKRFFKRFAKTSWVVQMWSEMLKISNQHIWLEMLSFQSKLCTSVKMQTSYISTLCICFGLCWHQNHQKGEIEREMASTFPIIDFGVWRPSQTLWTN